MTLPIPGNAPEPHSDAAFTGQFALRDWMPARWLEAEDDPLAREMASAMVSCRSAVLVLATGRPGWMVVADGSRHLLTPIDGELRLDWRTFAYSAHFLPDAPGLAVGTLGMRGSAHQLEFNLMWRRQCLQAYLFGRRSGHYTESSEPLQVFHFERIAPQTGARDASGYATPLPHPSTGPAPGWAQTPTPAPQSACTTETASEWTRKLRGTRLLHAGNDLETGYGTSSSIERSVVIKLAEDRFVLDRSISTRVSSAGMALSAPSYSQLTGAWSVFGANASRAWLELTTTEGERLTHCLGACEGHWLLVDGIPWKWIR